MVFRSFLWCLRWLVFWPTAVTEIRALPSSSVTIQQQQQQQQRQEQQRRRPSSSGTPANDWRNNWPSNTYRLRLPTLHRSQQQQRHSQSATARASAVIPSSNYTDTTRYEENVVSNLYNNDSNTPTRTMSPSTSPSSMPLLELNRIHGNATFCRKPDDDTAVLEYESLELCKLNDDVWKDLMMIHNGNTTKDTSNGGVLLASSSGSSGAVAASNTTVLLAQQRTYTGECGPHCRPSCVTLMLDVAKTFGTKTPNDGGESGSNTLKCRADQLCQCQHRQNSVATSSSSNAHCTKDNFDTLVREYPTCYLEEAHCLGPTVFEDTVAYMKSLLVDVNTAEADDWQKRLISMEQHCTAIPDHLYPELYARFQDWKLVTPMKLTGDCRRSDTNRSSSSSSASATTAECFPDDNDPSKLFFEYCNVVHEDSYCDNCPRGSSSCGTECASRVEPFPDGWTTFVVSASIPYVSGTDPHCDNVLNRHDSRSSAAVCFLERIDIYYPPQVDDANGAGLSCPHCHECPLLALGDTFGPLEVVGFGHEIDPSQPCAACDRPATRQSTTTTTTTGLNCEALSQCDAWAGCERGVPVENTGGLGFVDNACSFNSEAGGFFGEDWWEEPADSNTMEDSADSDDDKDDQADGDPAVDDNAVSTEDTEEIDPDGGGEFVSDDMDDAAKVGGDDTGAEEEDDSATSAEDVTEASGDISPEQDDDDDDDDDVGSRPAIPESAVQSEMPPSTSSHKHLVWPLAVLLGASCFVMLSVGSLIVRRRRQQKAVRKMETRLAKKANVEEIFYIDQVELNAIQSILEQQGAADDTDAGDSQDPDSLSLDRSLSLGDDNDNDNNSNRCRNSSQRQIPMNVAIPRDHGRWRRRRRSLSLFSSDNDSNNKELTTTPAIVRNFRSTTLLEQAGRDEVEATFITGNHIVGSAVP